MYIFDAVSLGIMEAKLRAILTPLEYHGTKVSGGLGGFSNKVSRVLGDLNTKVSWGLRGFPQLGIHFSREA